MRVTARFEKQLLIKDCHLSFQANAVRNTIGASDNPADGIHSFNVRKYQSMADFSAHGIWTEAVGMAIRECKGNKLQMAIISRLIDGSFFCDAFWAKSGYAISPICKHCEAGLPDTPYHRTFICISRDTERRELLDSRLVILAATLGPHSLLVARGIMAPPFRSVKPSRKQAVVRFVGKDGQDCAPYKMDPSKGPIKC